MAKIYSGVEGIPVPEFKADGEYQDYDKRCDDYITSIKMQARRSNPSCPEAGEVIYFPVGDGNAQYVVMSLKPVTLVHLAIGDAWHFQYANRLTAADVRREISRRAALNRIFSDLETRNAGKQGGK